MDQQKSNSSSKPKTMTYHNKNNRRGKGEGRRQFTPRKRVSESEDDGVCDLCVLPIKIYAIGYCDHPICYRCSAKMRVLCKQGHCAICRVELKKIIYSKSKRLFKEANELRLVKDGKQNNWFTDDLVKKEYKKLFEHCCKLCPESECYTSFERLQAHVRKDHKHFFCDICIEHNTNFTDECKTYTRESLARHRRIGDEDDTSHKGHPLCEFCDDRYVDNDVLLKHLRTDHYFCHFCDKEGRNQYYDEYIDLRVHYRKEHFLCEEGDCINEQFTSVFASELDLKAHRAAEHNQGLSRQQQKAERNIDLGFQYARPPVRGGRGVGITADDYTDRGSNKGRGRGRGGAGRGRYDKKEEEDIELAKALSLSQQNNTKDNEDTKYNPRAAADRPRVRRQEPPKRPPSPEEPTLPNLEEDFPTLGEVKSEEPTSLYTYSSDSKEGPARPEAAPVRAAEPKPVQHTVAGKVAAAVGRSRGVINEEEFPTLGSSKKTNPTQAAGIWTTSSTTSSNGNLKPQTSKNKVTGPVSVNMPPAAYSRRNVDIKSNSDFPTLGGGGKSTQAVGGVKSIWGQTIPAPAAPSHKAKTQKPRSGGKSKTPVATQEPTGKSKPKNTTQPDLFTQDETVSIRFGSNKHGMRLTTAKHSEDIADVEKPIEVPGMSGTSVKTVTADTFSLLSGSKNNSMAHSTSSNFNNYNVQENEFPELGGGARGGRIRGIGSSRMAGSWESSGNGKGQNTKKTSLSLADISNDIFSGSSMDKSSGSSSKNFSNEKREKSNKETKSLNSGTNSQDIFLSKEDFPSIAKPPPLSSYPADWNGEETSVADKVANERNFDLKEGDFPTLAGDMRGKKASGGKKNKKKKKNKSAPNVTDLTKHFGTVTIGGGESGGFANGGHLQSLLQGKNDAGGGLSAIIEHDPTFGRKMEKESSVENEQIRTVSFSNGNMALSEETEDDGPALNPRPDEDDIQGRNVWLIDTIQQVCGTDENFSVFKASSAQFRQGTMQPSIYYEKCRILLGKQHFNTVFSELVDLLPDEEKRDLLLQAHYAFLKS